MTTIAYRDGVLAADQLATTPGGLRGAMVVKIRRITGGRVALCGKFGAACAVADWLAKGREGDIPKHDDNGVIWIPDEGEATIIEQGCEEPLGEAPFHAWGSGREVAMGAMWMGATAVQAVEAAIALDTGSGGEITVLKGPYERRRVARS